MVALGDSGDVSRLVETVERIVAEKIISGALPAGSRLELTLTDLLS